MDKELIIEFDKKAQEVYNKESTPKTWRERFEEESKKWIYLTQFRKDYIKSFIAEVELQVWKEVMGIMEKHKKSDTYERDESVVFQTTMREISTLVEEKIKGLRENI